MKFYDKQQTCLSGKYWRFILKHVAGVLIYASGQMPAQAQSETQNAVETVIEVTGADDALRTNILAHLQIGNESCQVSLNRLQRLREQVQTNIRDAARALGYYQSEATLEFSEQDNCWKLLVAIEPGPAVTYSAVDITLEGAGNTESDFLDVLDENRIETGDTLNHGNYERLKNALSNTALENGFFSARFLQSEIGVDARQNTAELIMNFDTGDQYLIGELTLNNNTPLRDAFITRLMGMDRGDAYSTSRMFDMRENLDNSLYFDRIGITPDISSSGSNIVPVTVSLTPSPQHVYTVGAGFTTDTGPRLRASYENRYITSTGHRLDADIGFSKVRQELNSGYRIPLWNPVRQSLELRAGVVSEENDSYESDRFDIVTSYQHELESGWLSNYFVNFQKDDYVIEDQEDNSTLTILGVNYQRSRSDNVIFPRRGWHLFGQVSGATDTLMSDTTYLQVQVAARYIFSIGQLRFLQRVDVATTFIDDENELPASLRYFTGGDQTIRGYKYQSLGPENNGEVMGGKHMLVGSVEMDFPVRPNWRGAVFFDSGNAFSDFDNIDWKSGVGFGVRWLSPIGPVRIDLAHAINEGGVRLHVSMGPDL